MDANHPDPWWVNRVLPCIRRLSFSRFVLLGFDLAGMEWGTFRQYLRRAGVHLFHLKREGITIFQLTRNSVESPTSQDQRRQHSLWQAARTDGYYGEVWLIEPPSLQPQELQALNGVRQESARDGTKILQAACLRTTNKPMLVFRRLTDQERANNTPCLEPSLAEIPANMKSGFFLNGDQLYEFNFILGHCFVRQVSLFLPPSDAPLNPLDQYEQEQLPSDGIEPGAISTNSQVAATPTAFPPPPPDTVEALSAHNPEVTFGLNLDQQAPSVPPGTVYYDAATDTHRVDPLLAPDSTPTSQQLVDTSVKRSAEDDLSTEEKPAKKQKLSRDIELPVLLDATEATTDVRPSDNLLAPTNTSTGYDLVMLDEKGNIMPDILEGFSQHSIDSILQSINSVSTYGSSATSELSAEDLTQQSASEVLESERNTRRAGAELHSRATEILDFLAITTPKIGGPDQSEFEQNTANSTDHSFQFYMK